MENAQVLGSLEPLPSDGPNFPLVVDRPFFFGEIM